MRKLIILFIAAVCLAGCQKQKPAMITFDGLVTAIDSTVAEKYPSAKLYEMETVLKRSADSVLTDTIVPTQTKIVYDLGHDNTLVITFDSLGVATYTTYASPWMEDVCIPRVNFTLREALDILYKTDIIKPKTDFMTLRQPLYPGIAEPMYIFGNSQYYVTVGANTGVCK